MRNNRITHGAMGVAAALGASALGGPVTEPWAVGGSGQPAAVGAASLSGWYATADAVQNRVELRDITQTLVGAIDQAQISALLPWMSLDASPDGPNALAFSDSGRVLFIGVHDANLPGDGLGSDAVLRYDTQTGQLTVFARFEMQAGDAPAPYPSLVHFKGRLYVGGSGQVRVYGAGANDTTGAFIFANSAPAGFVVNGVCVDREMSHLYAAWNGQIFRATISGNTLPFVLVGPMPGARALLYSAHFGGAGQAGLYALASDGSGSALRFIPPAQARGQQAFAPTTYLSLAGESFDAAATADGAVLVAGASGASRVRDTSDTRLDFSSWTGDEFAQVVNFAKGLISPDGEPAGWVIDGDVQIGWNRFHPATPDGAAWTVLLLLMNDRVNNDAAAQGLVRQILQRYAGQAPDGIRPTRTNDGIFRHWIDPFTGGPKAGWDPEFATLSTMKIVLAAARARAYYPGDTVIRDAADAIICNVKNWDSYVKPSTDEMYFKGLGSGGPDAASVTRGFHEGFIFVEQVGRYGSAASQTVYAHWLDRSRWPTATFVTGRPMSSTAANLFQPAFISLYELLVNGDFRASPAWRTQIQNLRLSNAAWTDTNAPRWNTVFSAGTTRSDWGGYHADSLGDHAGDVATFPSLLAFSAGVGDGTPSRAEAVGGYHAYRVGARQTFKGGASILYRRSSVDPGYQPNSAGLPDVALGALGLAELLSPGSVAAVLTGAYPSCSSCPPDFDGDGFLSGDDFDAFVAAFETGDPRADFNADGFLSGDDFDAFVAAFEAGCG